jgi:hypothetical protein
LSLGTYTTAYSNLHLARKPRQLSVFRLQFALPMMSQRERFNHEGRKIRTFARRLVGGLGLAVLTTALVWGLADRSSAGETDSPTVRFTEGQIHGFLTLRTLDDAVIASGDLTQVNRGGRVTTELVFHFKDGSLQDETTVFSQNGRFRLLSDHLVQKGPSFKHPMDVNVNGTTGAVTVHSQDDNGKEKVETATLKIPPDLANGMVPVLLKNVISGTQSTTASMIVATPKPLLVKLAITPEGEDTFSTGGVSHVATRYDVKIDIPGVRGVVAPLVGKQPKDTHIWIMGGSSPAFVKSEGPFCDECPIWRIELTSPVWPKTRNAVSTSEKLP